MKAKITFIVSTAMLLSCESERAKSEREPDHNPIAGTWQLLIGTLIEKGDTTTTHYTSKTSFSKVINDTHFAFLQHDLAKGKDSAVFVAGGGTYSLKDSLYTEHLQYCSDRNWEGTDFSFTVSIRNDTLVQRGVEKVEAAGVNRLNIETYRRMKN